MKFLVLSILIVLGFSACSTKDNSDRDYKRANSASEKALNGLDEDTK